VGQPVREPGSSKDPFTGGLVRGTPGWWIARRVDAWVALGGALGAIARFGVGGWAGGWAVSAFPWATFLVNASGSTLLGFVHGALPPPGKAPSRRAFLTVGLCGGFTTFSAFDQEVLALLQRGEHTLAAAYALASVATCVAGVWAGFEGGRRTGGPRGALRGWPG
jgi:fluoride exporter